MSDAWREKVGRVLEEARKRPPEKRKAFLEERCEEEALREEVASLLRAHEEEAGLFAVVADRVAASVLGELMEAGSTKASTPDAGAPDRLGLEGSQVGRYEVEEHLGGGGMGIVYRARDPQLDRPVVLKFLPPHLSAHPEAQRRFAREAKAASVLEHANIATIYEIGQAEDGAAEGQRFIAMAYYEGETLREKLRREGALPVEKALRYAEQVAEALSRAHEAGIVHRDVKPANVMVTETGEVKLLDFGLAKAAAETRLTDPGQQMGTAAYMSPEQAKGEEVDDRTDLWGLGAMLYEMLAGERPFQGSPQAAVIYSILHEEPVPLEVRRGDTEANLEQVIGRCLKKDPGQRYESAEALLEDLHAVQEKDVPESDASPSYQTIGLSWSPISDLAMPRSVRRRPVGQQWLAGGAAAVALLLLLLGWALWPEGSATESKSRATVPSFSQSIAVLPFETVGTGEATGFTEGIHGDILTRLSNISGLKVISRTSVQQYRKTQKPTTEIGQELGAGWVLEGEVQEVGGQVQVNARLINAQTDQQAWASDYRRKLTAVNLFEIQEEITREISSSLEAQLTPEEKKRVENAPTQDLEAYRHYVQGRQALDQMTSDEDLRQAGKHFQKALAEDSTFALAWAGLADAIGRNLYQEAGSDSLRLPKVSQEEAARRALDLNPDLAEAHAALGYVHFIQHEGPAALRRFRRAVELKPSYAEAQKFLGGLLLPLGLPKEALKHFQLAKDLNPQHVLARHGLYDAYLANNRPEMALLEAREQQRMYPEYEQAVWGEIRALYHLDRFEEAVRIARQRLADSNTTHEEVALCSYLVAAEAAVGDTAQARSQLDKLESISVPEEGLDRYRALSSIAYAALGNVDAAFGAYQKIDKWPWFAALELRYLFFPEARRKLQNDPRYKELIREINLYWGLKPDGSLPEEN